MPSSTRKTTAPAKKAARKALPATDRRGAAAHPGASRKDSQGHSIPPRLFAQVSPRSVGGMSMFDYGGPIDEEVVSNFLSEAGTLRRAAQALEDAGFEVLQISPYTINIAAPIATYERAFKTEVVPHELRTIKSFGISGTATFFSGEDPSHFGLLTAAGTPFEKLVEGVAIEEPRYYMAPLPLAPRKGYWHLGVPGDVSLGCNADRAHRGEITGRGVRVAMVDSGQAAHPFFTARGYRVQAVTLGPGASDPATDDNGHGTAESTNIFALAPDAELLPVKMSFTNSTGAFNAAVALAPDIITCSWGSDVRRGPLSPANQALAVAIADAVARGIVVVFSAGNGHFGFPGQHPDVISAGGAYIGPDGSLQASDYASGFASPVYQGRRVPDLCGLVGMRPRAAYILLPLQPGCEIDAGLAGGTHPNGDETAEDDGWAAISGTSAAAPQLAGAAALVKQACPRLAPAEVRDVLVRTAVDVTAGICNPASSGAAAGPGPDLATGAGLVDAHAAVLVAKLRCLGPGEPAPTPAPAPSPVPTEPEDPCAPGVRISTLRPARAWRPGHPQRIVEAAPPRAALQATAHAPHRSSTPAALSGEDIAALESLVIRGKLDAFR